MIRVSLTEADVRALESEFRSTADRRLRDRLQIVLLAHKGRPRYEIAADLCLDRRSVQRWLRAYADQGRAGLTPGKAKGKEPGIPVEMADEIRRWVIEGPPAQGLDRANWTYEELAAHLFKAKGIRTSRSAMHRFCSKIDIRPYRPTYRYLRGDLEKQTAAKEELGDLKKKRKRAKSCS